MGNDRKAEVEFLGALDAEPTTYGACAAYLSVLRQVEHWLSAIIGTIHVPYAEHWVIVSCLNVDKVQTFNYFDSRRSKISALIRL